MQYLGHTYAKKLFSVYLKFKFNWASFSFICWIPRKDMSISWCLAIPGFILPAFLPILLKCEIRSPKGVDKMTGILMAESINSSLTGDISNLLRLSELKRQHIPISRSYFFPHQEPGWTGKQVFPFCVCLREIFLVCRGWRFET